jgi:hypothetical protein
LFDAAKQSNEFEVRAASRVPGFDVFEAIVHAAREAVSEVDERGAEISLRAKASSDSLEYSTSRPALTKVGPSLLRQRIFARVTGRRRIPHSDRRYSQASLGDTTNFSQSVIFLVLSVARNFCLTLRKEIVGSQNIGNIYGTYVLPII